jgi:hypothetical protein
MDKEQAERIAEKERSTIVLITYIAYVDQETLKKLKM